MARNKRILISAPTLRAAVRSHCTGAENHYMDCYKKVRDALGLTRSTKSRDTGIVASEFNRMLKEKEMEKMTALYAMGLERLDNMTLAAANTALHGFGKIDAKNLAFDTMRSLDYIKETGIPYDHDMLMDALAFVIKQRMDTGTFN